MNPEDKILYADRLSVNGYSCDVLFSALQKFIRRGMVEEAVTVAYELSRTDREMCEVLWKRLLVISVEDIGMGDALAPVQVYCINETRKNFRDDPGEFGMFFVHAIRYLCHCSKDRSSCILAQLTEKRIQKGARIEFPDYVYDKHTEKGIAMGRDHRHFMEVASQVIPDAAPPEAKKWKQELYELTLAHPNTYNFMGAVEYADVRSPGGYPCDLLVSALQKSIRRGNTELAVHVAYELASTSPYFLELLWKRLVLISVEDVCLANPTAQILVHTLNRIRKENYSDGKLHGMYFTHAIRYMCTSEKERGSCDLEHLAEKKLALGLLTPELPDYVYDKHTVQGLRMGRGERHFLTEAAYVTPMVNPDQNNWLEEFLEYCED